MKRLLFILAVLLCAWGAGATGYYRQLLMLPRAAASAAAPVGPVVWIDQQSDDDYWGNSPAPIAQYIQVTNSVTITKASIKGTASTAEDGQVYIQFWSTANGTGVQYGSNSSTNTYAMNSGVAWRENTWVVPVTLTTNCFMVVKTSGSVGAWRVGRVAGGARYLNTTFCFYRGGSVIDSGLADLCMMVYKQ